jgi:hypothetical protein
MIISAISPEKKEESLDAPIVGAALNAGKLNGVLYNTDLFNKAFHPE